MKSLKCNTIPVFVLLGILFGVLACEEAVDWEFQAGANEVLVVEAILTDEFIQQEIQLSLSYDNLNGLPTPVLGADVRVEANGISYRFSQDLEYPGRYRSEFPFAVLDDLPYELQVEWQGQFFTATTELSVVAPLPAITFLPYENTDSLRIPNFAPIYNANQQAMYELNVDWSHLVGEDSARAKLLYFTFSTINTGGLIRPAVDTLAFPKGSIVVAKKFGLNPDFADYLRAMVLETQWRGSVFYGPAANLPTNIEGGALGFFSACAVLVDTLVAQ